MSSKAPTEGDFSCGLATDGVSGSNQTQKMTDGALRGLSVDEWATYLESVVGPRSEFQLALLIIEREPGDVDLAGAAEDAGRDVIAAAVAAHHHVRLVRAVEFLIGTIQMKFKKKWFWLILQFFKEKIVKSII